MHNDGWCVRLLQRRVRRLSRRSALLCSMNSLAHRCSTKRSRLYVGIAGAHSVGSRSAPRGSPVNSNDTAIPANSSDRGESSRGMKTPLTAPVSSSGNGMRPSKRWSPTCSQPPCRSVASWAGDASHRACATRMRALCHRPMPSTPPAPRSQ